MADLKKEYRDMKNVRHKVEHCFASAQDQDAQDHKTAQGQMLQELYQILTRPDGACRQKAEGKDRQEAEGKDRQKAEGKGRQEAEEGLESGGCSLCKKIGGAGKQHQL